MLKKRMLFVVLLMLALALTSCSPIVEDIPKQVTVYATFYPIYALANEIIKDVPDLELHCLVQPQDGCLRNYSLSDWDLYMLTYGADGVIAGGSGLESFTDRLEELAADQFVLIESLHGLTLFQGNGSIGEDEIGGHFHGNNPHLYLSVNGAAEIMESLASSMAMLDGRYTEIYRKNLEIAQLKLKLLKQDIQKETSVCIGKKAALMNEALFYPAQDYGLEIATWIERESGEMLYDQALDECILQLKENGVEVVLIEQQAPKALVDALELAGFPVAKLDILTTHTGNEGSQVYFDALRANALAVGRIFAVQ